MKNKHHRPNGAAALALFIALLFTLLGGCGPAVSAPNLNQQAKFSGEVIVYDWVGDLPDEVLDSFNQEYNVTVRMVTYESQEEAVENIRAGEVYDVVIMDDRLVAPLITEGLLARLDLNRIGNFGNIAPDFRSPSFDPGNQYSIPYSYGTVGLVVRTSMVSKPVTSWNDLWNQESAGKVILWKGSPREVIGGALKSLGYSVNTENPAELRAALTKLKALKKNALFVEDFEDPETIAPELEQGYAVMGIGWANDALTSIERMDDIAYVLPKEGTMKWGDNFVIPANSPHKEVAEAFINYLLRPEISAIITNAKYYASPNIPSEKYVIPALRADPIIYPLPKDLAKAELILALSPEGDQLYEQLWEEFLNAE